MIYLFMILNVNWYYSFTKNQKDLDGSWHKKFNLKIKFFILFYRQNSSKSSTKNIVSGRKYEAEYKKRDAQYTRASVVMVMAFIVCNTPRFIPNVMEIFVELDQWPQVSTECFVKFLYIHYLLSHFKNFICKAKTNVYHVRRICHLTVANRNYSKALRSTFFGEWNNSCSSKSCIIRSILCYAVFKI